MPNDLSTYLPIPIPRCKLSQICSSSITYAGPRLWNELPQNIRDAKTLGSFKILLKTYLFINPFYLSVNILIMCKLGHGFFICWITLHLLKFQSAAIGKKTLMYSSTPAEFFITFLTTFCHVLTLFLIAQ